jgi:hypothetical protein
MELSYHLEVVVMFHNIYLTRSAFFFRGICFSVSTSNSDVGLQLFSSYCHLISSWSGHIFWNLILHTWREWDLDNCCVVTVNKGKYKQTQQDALLEDCKGNTFFPETWRTSTRQQPMTSQRTLLFTVSSTAASNLTNCATFAKMYDI